MSNDTALLDERTDHLAIKISADENHTVRLHIYPLVDGKAGTWNANNFKESDELFDALKKQCGAGKVKEMGQAEFPPNSVIWSITPAASPKMAGRNKQNTITFVERFVARRQAASSAASPEHVDGLVSWGTKVSGMRDAISRIVEDEGLLPDQKTDALQRLFSARMRRHTEPSRD